MRDCRDRVFIDNVSKIHFNCISINLTQTVLFLFHFRLSKTPANIPYSLVFGIFLLLIGSAGFVVGLTRNENLKIIFAYSLIVQFVLVLVLVILAGIHVNRNALVDKIYDEYNLFLSGKITKTPFLDTVHYSLKCCASPFAHEGHIPDDWKITPKSCCLDSSKVCTKGLAFKGMSGCFYCLLIFFPPTKR